MKRLACVLLTAALLLCSFSAAADERATPARLLGDVNKDGKVNTTDARQILQGMAGIQELHPAVKPLANADGDERLSTTDARYVLRYAAGIDTVPKAGVLNVGEAALFNYKLADLPFEVNMLFQMMGAAVEVGKVPYYALQMDSKQQLEELVSLGANFLGDGLSAETKAYLEAHDEAFFATDSVVLVLYPETFSQYKVEALTQNPGGAWTLALHEYTNAESTAVPSKNTLQVLVLDVDRAALDGGTVTAAEIAAQEPLTPAE